MTGVQTCALPIFHSGYLEALLGVGLIGTLPLLYGVYRAARWSANRLRRVLETSFAILMIPLVVHTFVDLGFGAWLKPDFLLLVSLVALADIERRPEQDESVAMSSPQLQRQQALVDWSPS